MLPIERIGLICCGLAAVGSVALGQAQQAAQRTPGYVANAWMRTPTDASAPDAVLTPLRSRRDQYWDDRIGERLPLRPDEEIMVTSGAEGAGGPEIPDLSDKAAMVATFTSNRSILTNSGRAIYTEITLRATDVIRDEQGHAVPGRDITLAIGGGAVRTAAGVLTFRAQPIEHYLEPKHTYFLILRYRAGEDFYILNRDWDLSTGVVRANADIDIRREAVGGSEILGLTKDQLISAISARLKKN